MKHIIGILLLLMGNLNQGNAVENMQANIEEVKNRHEAQLLSLPGVVSVGIGLDDNKQAIIVVGISADNEALKARLPQQLEGHRVSVEYIGKVRAQ